MSYPERPILEGSVGVRQGRRLSFAEFGARGGRAVIWMHGTPGARRQIPLEARVYAEEHGLRLIGLDRPGVGSSTPHQYRDVFDWTHDLELVLDTLEIDSVRLVGLSGGAPYVLAGGAALPGRVRGLGILGGVGPLVGADAVDEGLRQLAALVGPLVSLGRVPLGLALSQGVRLVRPFAGPAISAYAAFQPAGDKRLLTRPEFRAMFLDDLVNGSRFQISAPVSDLVLFTRHWGFELSDVSVPVRWWHGTDDHIVPLAHGRHAVARLAEARFSAIPGESHLGGLGIATEVLDTVLAMDGPGSSARITKSATGITTNLQSQ